MRCRVHGLSFRGFISERKEAGRGCERTGDQCEPGGLELHDIAIALQKAGVKVIADWDPADIHDGAIVCIRGKAPYADDHYILKTPSGWMDPWYNIGNNLREARYREEYPSGTYFLVALVPVNGQ